MKVLVIFGLLFAYSQAAGHEEFLQQTADAVKVCVQEKKLDGRKILGLLTKGDLPEDDAEFTDFFNCYYTKLGLLKNNELDKDVMKKLLPLFIKQKFGDAVDAQKLGEEGWKHCESIPQDSNGTILAIRARNCILKYAAEHK